MFWHVLNITGSAGSWRQPLWILSSTADCEAEEEGGKGTTARQRVGNYWETGRSAQAANCSNACLIALFLSPCSNVPSLYCNTSFPTSCLRTLGSSFAAVCEGQDLACAVLHRICFQLHSWLISTVSDGTHFWPWHDIQGIVTSVRCSYSSYRFIWPLATMWNSDVSDVTKSALVRKCDQGQVTNTFGIHWDVMRALQFQHLVFWCGRCIIPTVFLLWR